MEKSEAKIQRKPRVLCLHGFRTSGKVLQNLIFRWPEIVIEALDMVFMDAPYPAGGRSAVEGIYDPPYYEWFQSDQGFNEYFNFEECLSHRENYMSHHGPFDGVLGISQGAVLAAALPGMQKEGTTLTKVPTIRFVILVSWAKFGGSMFGVPKLVANAFSSPINCPSLHIIGGESLEKILEFVRCIQEIVDSE